MVARTIPEQRQGLRKIIAEQLKMRREWSFVGETYERLRSAGFSDEEVCNLLMKVLATEYYRWIMRQQPFEPARYELGLRRLPLLPWQADESGYPCDVTEQEVSETILDNPGFHLQTVDEVIEHYRRLRPQLTRLQDAILHRVSREDIMASGQRLGLVHEGILMFDGEDDTAVLMDHILYADPRARRRHLEAHARAHAGELSDEERALLAAMAEARYALMRCESAIPRAGLQVTDLLRGDSFLLADKMAAQTGSPGAVLAAHVVTIDGVHMQTGASLPVPDRASLEAVIAVVPGGRWGFDERNADGKYTSRIIRALLRSRALMGDAETPSPAVSRNAPCPCGSGKKYKRCCGARSPW